MRRKIVFAWTAALLVLICIVFLFFNKGNADSPNTHEAINNEYPEDESKQTTGLSEGTKETELPEIEVETGADESNDTVVNENDHTDSSTDPQHEDEQQNESGDDPGDVYIDENGVIELPEVP